VLRSALQPAQNPSSEKTTALIIGFENGEDLKNPFAKKPNLKNKSILEQKH
jgi:hypothetical protein